MTYVICNWDNIDNAAIAVGYLIDPILEFITDYGGVRMFGYEEWSCKQRGEKVFSFREGDTRRWYQRDIDQIVHSTAFRKLQKKSQLLSEKDPRVRSRLIHTIEVSRIAKEISERLGLSVELTEAISMGHDIATSPYGYVGNAYLSKKVKGSQKDKQKYTHELAGAYMVESIASKELGPGELKDKAVTAFMGQKQQKVCINIKPFPNKIWVSRKKKPGVTEEYTYFGYFISPEVIDGIEQHGTDGRPATLEGQVVRFADNIAYLSQDIDDMLYTKIIPDNSYLTHFRQDDKIRIKDKEMTWSKIDEQYPAISLKSVYDNSRGVRISTFIERFVGYNLQLLSENSYIKARSSILEKDIPQLQCDEGMEHVVNALWDFIGGKYRNELIDTAGQYQKVKIDILWKILCDKQFIENNECYKRFRRMLEDSRFLKSSENWKKSYFISHLSWSDIDTIIDAYHQRDRTFELDVMEDGYENC